MEIQLQSKVPIPEGEPKIVYDSRIVLLGSCFSENIGERFLYHKFDTWINPFGIIFNPYSLTKLLQKVVQKKSFQQSDIIERDGLWYSLDVHSSLTDTDYEYLLKKLNAQLEECNRYLKTTTHVFVSLGTAWVYRYLKSQEIVANCHKIPAKEFSKELLSVEEIKKQLQLLVMGLKNLNPSIQIVFTISPVRHAKDGWIENNRSKARLIEAVHALLEDNAGPAYFPSYEIMMDELRDYRFYETDLLHPNRLAIEYVWERFQKAWIADASQEIMKKVSIVQKGLAHKPFNPEHQSHEQFLKDLSIKIDELKTMIPGIQF